MRFCFEDFSACEIHRDLSFCRQVPTPLADVHQKELLRGPCSLDSRSTIQKKEAEKSTSKWPYGYRSFWKRKKCNAKDDFQKNICLHNKVWSCSFVSHLFSWKKLSKDIPMETMWNWRLKKLKSEITSTLCPRERFKSTGISCCKLLNSHLKDFWNQQTEAEKFKILWFYENMRDSTTKAISREWKGVEQHINMQNVSQEKSDIRVSTNFVQLAWSLRYGFHDGSFLCIFRVNWLHFNRIFLSQT